LARRSPAIPTPALSRRRSTIAYLMAKLNSGTLQAPLVWLRLQRRYGCGRLPPRIYWVCLHNLMCPRISVCHLQPSRWWRGTTRRVDAPPHGYLLATAISTCLFSSWRPNVATFSSVLCASRDAFTLRVSLCQQTSATAAILLRHNSLAWTGNKRCIKYASARHHHRLYLAASYRTGVYSTKNALF